MFRYNFDFLRSLLNLHSLLYNHQFYATFGQTYNNPKRVGSALLNPEVAVVRQ